MKTRSLILFFALLILFAACRTPRYIYSPAPPNNPYFKEKGESKLAAYYSTGGDANELTNGSNNGFDVQAAYAVTNHFLLTAEYFKRREKDDIFDYDRSYFDSSVVKYKRHLTGFGAGFFSAITDDNKISTNILSGIGFGKFSFIDDGIENGAGYSRYYNSKMSKWYVQSSLNFLIGNFFRTALIGKVSWVHYYKISTSYTPDELNYLDLDRLPARTLSFFEGTWDVGVTFKEAKWLFLEGSVSFSSDPFENRYINIEARDFNASIGVGLDFSRLKKKMKIDRDE